MKSNLEKKIAQYKDEKAKKSNLEALIQEKRRNLEKIINTSNEIEIEKENDFRI